MPPADQIHRYAPALIETMRLADGRIALWPGHRARLLASAHGLGYPVDAARLDAWLAACLHGPHPARWQLPAAQGPQATHDAATPPPAPSADAQVWRLRLLLAPDGGLSLESAPLGDTPVPVRIALADTCLPADTAWLAHKTTHRPWFVAAQQWLQAHPDHFDLIFCNSAGALCEGSRSNIYVRDTQGQWLTPPVRAGLLPGVQRQALLDQERVRVAQLGLPELLDAPALRVSNALRGWLDAVLQP